MAWAPLPDDVPLDHEQLPPPRSAPAAAPQGFVPLPDNAPLDQAAPAQINGQTPQASDAPIIIAAIRPHPKAEEVNPSYTVKGFDGEVAPDQQLHSQLSKSDKQEYASFFHDPKHPPSAAQLQLWYHGKTGALLGNAQDIVDHFRKTGQFSTAEHIAVPAKHQSAAAAGINHVANAAALDWGPEGASVLDALGLGGSDHPNVFTSGESIGNVLANNADMERAQLNQDTADHPVASLGGELAGTALTTPLLAGAGNAAGMAKLAENAGEFNRTLIQGTAEGAAYGSGAAGPGHRLEGASVGAATVPAVAGVSRLPAAAAGVTKSVLEGSPGLARRIIAKAIKDDMNTPESVGQSIEDAQSNGVPMALGDTGENVRGLLAASSRASGVGRSVVRDALEERQSALADRITQHIERDLGPVANPHKVADDLMTKAKTEAAPIYDKLYSQPAVASDAIDTLLQRPSMQKALKNAYTIAKEEGRDPESLGLRVGEDGKVVLEPGQALSYQESLKANPSRFADVAIPDEMKSLGVRTITTNSGRKVKVRGPLDITQSLRLMGGISDDRGDLAHMGITNAARRMPFGSNEQFLGNLINPNGMSLDDAAHKLWEEGYFPESRERPTIHDLVDKLHAESTGAQRYFHPDTYEEIADFNKAKAQRYGLEEKAASGTPAADDRSYPVSMVQDALNREGPVSAGRQPLVRKTYTPQTLDYIKRGMDDVVEGYRDPVTGKLNLDTEGRAVNNTLRSYMGTVDQLYPDYAKARATYAGPVKGIAAMNDGRKALSDTADDVEAKLRDMSPFEKTMYATGIRRAMAELVQSKGDTADIVHALVGTGKKRAMLARAFGDRKQFQRFVDTLGQEKEGWRSFKTALGGSPTAANMKDDQALEGAAMAADFAAGGMPVATATSKAVKLLRFKLGEKAQQQIAALLSNTDPAAIRELAAELRAKAEQRGIRLRKLGVATNAVGKGALVTSGQQSQ